MPGSSETGVKACVLRGAREICAYVGINHKEMMRYVEQERLPAFKHGASNIWVALPEDLKAWVAWQRERRLENKPEKWEVNG